MTGRKTPSGTGSVLVPKEGRERDRDRQTDRQTDRQKDRPTKKKRKENKNLVSQFSSVRSNIYAIGKIHMRFITSFLRLSIAFGNSFKCWCD